MTPAPSVESVGPRLQALIDRTRAEIAAAYSGRRTKARLRQFLMENRDA